MTGPSTMAHHHELHALVRDLQARLAEAERHQHGNADFHCDYCGYPPQRDPNDSRSPPERESGDSMHLVQGGNGPRDGSAAAKSGGNHRAHWFLAGDVLDVCAVCGRHLDAHDDLPEDENDDPDDERECLG